MFSLKLIHTQTHTKLFGQTNFTYKLFFTFLSRYPLVSAAEDFDESELMKELEDLEQEELNSELLEININEHKLPEVPANDIKEPSIANKDKKCKRPVIIPVWISIEYNRIELNVIKICNFFQPKLWKMTMTWRIFWLGQIERIIVNKLIQSSIDSFVSGVKKNHEQTNWLQFIYIHANNNNSRQRDDCYCAGDKISGQENPNFHLNLILNWPNTKTYLIGYQSIPFHSIYSTKRLEKKSYRNYYYTYTHTYIFIFMQLIRIIITFFDEINYNFIRK